MLISMLKYMRGCLFRLNFAFDKVKEPWRLLIAIALVAPCFWGLDAESYSIRYISIAYLIILLISRMYWRHWLRRWAEKIEKEAGGDK